MNRGRPEYWIAASKRKPPTSTAEKIVRVMVVCDWYNEAIVGWYFAHANEWRVEGSNSPAPVTHWQPLPIMPENERRKRGIKL